MEGVRYTLPMRNLEEVAVNKKQIGDQVASAAER
jgi:hypothetical protein